MTETIVISSPGLRQLPKGFPNMAGVPDIDDALEAELKAAEIEIYKWGDWHEPKGEVKTRILGTLHNWKFERAWYYWRASGPGLPPQYADALHTLFGKEVRVDGHCGCPSPLEWGKGFAIGNYHVDTPRGLLALATALKACANDAAIRLAKASS